MNLDTKEVFQDFSKQDGTARGKELGKPEVYSAHARKSKAFLCLDFSVRRDCIKGGGPLGSRNHNPALPLAKIITRLECFGRMRTVEESTYPPG